jgi:chemotaxis signal transduction protein
MNDETASGRHPTLNNITDTGSVRDDALRERQPQTTRKLQLVSVGPHVLGIFEDEIATIAEWRRPTPLPHAPSAMLGVVSIQGRMLTVLNPLSFFDETTTRPGFPPGILIALRGEEQIALAIENTGAKLDVAMEDIERPSHPANSAFGGIIQYGDQLVNVIRVKGLFPAALRGRERRSRRF